MEWAELGNAPDGCWRHNTTFIPFILSGVWVNDTQVADHLAQKYGITTYVAQFETGASTDAMGRTAEWRMHHDGRTSWLSVQVTDDRVEWVDLKQRLYWFPPWGGVGYMDWDIIRYTGERIDVTTLAMGHLEPPLLMSQWPTEYVDNGQYAQNGFYRGEIQLFKDVLCEEPL